MSSRRELDDGIKSIKSAWRREHTARDNLERMLKNSEAENVELRELVRDMWRHGMCECEERQDCAECKYGFLDRMRELGIEVE